MAESQSTSLPVARDDLALSSMVSSRPGVPQWEGPQTPAVTIEKIAPEQVQVGRSAAFRIVVRNAGQVPAEHVTVLDAVPEGTRLVSTSPQAEVQQNMMLWRLGRLDVGQSVSLSYVVVPEREGELGSVAQVSFAAAAGARTVSTRPIIQVSVTAPATVLIGQMVPLLIQVRNEGTGPAYNVVLDEDVPETLSHPAGRELQNVVGTLQPGESRTLELPLMAQQAGKAVNRVRVRDDHAELARAETPIEVLAPKLALRWSGPSMRFLDRDAVHELAVVNDGTAPAQNVQLIAVLPKGVRFVAADKLGRYVPERHAVYWSLVELPVGQQGVVKLTTRAVGEGQQLLRAQAAADLGASAQADHMMRVESAADLQFSVVDLADPVEVNAEVLYEITLANQGTKPDTNLVVTVSGSKDLELLEMNGPGAAQVTPEKIELAAIPEIRAGQRMVWQVRARARAAGPALLRVQVRSDQMPQPITKEEGTRIYGD